MNLLVLDIRLAGSEVAGEGRLEIKFGGKWGTVCDDLFNDLDASVACSMLDLGYATDMMIFSLCRPTVYLFILKQATWRKRNRNELRQHKNIQIRHKDKHY